MPSTREMRLRIKSVKSLSQVTRALETVSASKVKRAMAANSATLPYAEKAWKVLVHLARQPGHASLHPLLNERKNVNRILVIMISGDSGLAGSYNVNILKYTMENFSKRSVPVDFVAVGKKGRDMLIRRRFNVVADFPELGNPATFIETSAASRLAVDDYLHGKYDQVYITYTRFISMSKQETAMRKLLPLEMEEKDRKTVSSNQAVFTYEPEQKDLLDEIIPRFTAMQVYQAILSSQASEHAARMMAMATATDNANALISALQLDYNKARQQIITNEMLDIVGGAAALESR